MQSSKHNIKIQDKTITFELEDLAEQANGHVLVRIGDTVVLVTAVMSDTLRPEQDFFPLTVDFEEKFYAAGKILGSRFIRREGRPSDEAIITSRVIDRAIRPLFPDGFKQDVQIIITCLSWDGENDPDIAGLLGASLALTLSDIPWGGPLGSLRIARIDGAFVVNPTYEQRKQSEIDFVIAAVKERDEVLLNMVEGEGQEAAEEVFQNALEFAMPHVKELIDFQEKLAQKTGKEKVSPIEIAEDELMVQEIGKFLSDRLESVFFQEDKQARMLGLANLQDELLQFVLEQYPDSISYARSFFDEEVNQLVHKTALEKEKRVDDRKLTEFRDMQGEAGILPRTHGSGLFERGQTKTLTLLTLGSPGDQRLMEGMEFIGKKHFMHHYNFPPYAPGEVKPLRGPGRREIGHGLLAEKALLPVIPTLEEFPYTIRIVTEVLSSNGSTSMASVCSSSLALMDAGVPIKHPVAGISIGLMQGKNGEYKLLTDIQGPEDHYGDMDFKVAGTKEGITAIQLDVKVKGITQKIFAEALAEGKRVRYHILDKVFAKVLSEPRKELSQWAPHIYTLHINPEKIGQLIGPGGKTINKITEEYNVQIDIEETGDVFVTGDQDERTKEAIKFIEDMTREVQPGEIFQGEVKRIMDFGAFVEIPGGQEGLVHISQLAPFRVHKVEDVVKVGDTIPVKVLKIDEQGRINLSLKEAQKDTTSNQSQSKS